MTTAKWERRASSAELRADASGRRIVGYGIRFNTLSEDLGGFRERILPSAIDRTIRERIDLRGYYNHDSSVVLGRLSAGTMAIEKDADGVRVEIHPPDTAAARDLITSIRRGDITGMSFRFRVVPGGERWITEGQTPIREISDMLVGEFSVVSEPAYPDTTVAARSLGAFRHGRQKGTSWYLARLRIIEIEIGRAHV